MGLPSVQSSPNNLLGAKIIDHPVVIKVSDLTNSISITSSTDEIFNSLADGSFQIGGAKADSSYEKTQNEFRKTAEIIKEIVKEEVSKLDFMVKSGAKLDFKGQLILLEPFKRKAIENLLRLSPDSKAKKLLNKLEVTTKSNLIHVERMASILFFLDSKKDFSEKSAQLQKKLIALMEKDPLDKNSGFSAFHQGNCCDEVNELKEKIHKVLKEACPNGVFETAFEEHVMPAATKNVVGQLGPQSPEIMSKLSDAMGLASTRSVEAVMAMHKALEREQPSFIRDASNLELAMAVTELFRSAGKLPVDNDAKPEPGPMALPGNGRDRHINILFNPHLTVHCPSQAAGTPEVILGSGQPIKSTSVQQVPPLKCVADGGDNNRNDDNLEFSFGNPSLPVATSHTVVDPETHLTGVPPEKNPKHEDVVNSDGFEQLDATNVSPLNGDDINGASQEGLTVYEKFMLGVRLWNAQRGSKNSGGVVSNTEATTHNFDDAGRNERGSRRVSDWYGTPPSGKWGHQPEGEKSSPSTSIPRVIRGKLVIESQETIPAIGKNHREVSSDDSMKWGNGEEQQADLQSANFQSGQAPSAQNGGTWGGGQNHNPLSSSLLEKTSSRTVLLGQDTSDANHPGTRKDHSSLHGGSLVKYLVSNADTKDTTGDSYQPLGEIVDQVDSGPPKAETPTRPDGGGTYQDAYSPEPQITQTTNGDNDSAGGDIRAPAGLDAPSVDEVDEEQSIVEISPDDADTGAGSGREFDYMPITKPNSGKAVVSGDGKGDSAQYSQVGGGISQDPSASKVPEISPGHVKNTMSKFPKSEQENLIIPEFNVHYQGSNSDPFHSSETQFLNWQGTPHHQDFSKVTQPALRVPLKSPSRNQGRSQAESADLADTNRSR